MFSTTSGILGHFETNILGDLFQIRGYRDKIYLRQFFIYFLCLVSKYFLDFLHDKNAYGDGTHFDLDGFGNRNGKGCRDRIIQFLF